MEISTLAGQKPRIAVITIYPREGSASSQEIDLSALAGYCKELFGRVGSLLPKDVCILTNQKSEAPREFRDGPLLVIECWSKGSLLYWLQIIRELSRRDTLRVVHLQHEFNQFGGILTVFFIPLMLGIIRFVLRRRIVVQFHEVVGRHLFDNPQFHTLAIPVPRFLASFAARVYYQAVSITASIIVVQDERFRDVVQKEHRIKKPVEIVRIGWHPERHIAAKSEARARLHWPPDKRTLLFFGTIDRRKGLDLLLDAFAMLDAQQYELVVGGGLPVRSRDNPDFQRWFTNLNERMQRLSGVRCIGYVSDDDVPFVFAAADLAVLPYLVPQVVSAVQNMAISYNLPFIVADSFEGRLPELFNFHATPQGLAEKIEWCFGEGHQALCAAVKELRNRDLWNDSALIVKGIYETLLLPTPVPD